MFALVSRVARHSRDACGPSKSEYGVVRSQIPVGPGARSAQRRRIESPISERRCPIGYAAQFNDVLSLIAARRGDKTLCVSKPVGALWELVGPSRRASGSEARVKDRRGLWALSMNPQVGVT